MFVRGLTLGHQIWVYLYVMFAIYSFVFDFTKMYGVDVKEGRGRGLDLNVHWTLNFFF